MPLHIQNQALYADRTFQDWHRQVMPYDHDAIDVDLVGVCRNWQCRDPLYWVESTTRDDKPSTILARLGFLTNAHAFVVQHDTETLTGVRGVFDPNGGSSSLRASGDVSEALQGVLSAIRSQHMAVKHGG